MLSVDIFSRTPVYRQVVDAMREQVRLGVFKPGEQVPSIRELSLELNVNPNTVFKAYAELERSGVLAPAAGRGYFVAQDAPKRILSERLAKEWQAFRDAVNRLAEAGVSAGELEAELRKCCANEPEKRTG